MKLFLTSDQLSCSIPTLHFFQDDEVGDGTTSVVVFASELLREAEKLVETRIHPQTIIAGWRKATKIARDALEASVRICRFLLRYAVLKIEVLSRVVAS